MKRILVSFLGLTVAFGTTFAGVRAQQTKHERCFNIGDTVSVKGHIVPGVNAGTYFEVAEPLCVHFPKPTDHDHPLSLETLGQKLPPNIYLEVKGQLRDLFSEHLFGIGIETSTFRDMDAEFKANLEREKRSCEQWQDANSAALRKRAHGAQVVRDPQNSGGTNYAGGCAIWAVDNELPHEEFIVRRPKP